MDESDLPEIDYILALKRLYGVLYRVRSYRQWALYNLICGITRSLN